MFEISDHHKEDIIKLMNMLICEMPLVKSMNDEYFMERLYQLVLLFESSYNSINTQFNTSSVTNKLELSKQICLWLQQYYNAKYISDAMNFSNDENAKARVAILVLSIIHKVRHSLLDVKVFFDACQCLVQFDEMLNDITRFDKLLELIQNELNRWKCEAGYYKVKILDMKKQLEKYEQSNSQWNGPLNGQSNGQSYSQIPSQSQTRVSTSVNDDKPINTEMKRDKETDETDETDETYNIINANLGENIVLNGDTDNDEDDDNDDDDNNNDDLLNSISTHSPLNVYSPPQLEPQIDIITSPLIPSVELIEEMDENDIDGNEINCNEIDCNDIDINDALQSDNEEVSSEYLNCIKRCTECDVDFYSNFEFNVHLLRDHATIKFPCPGLSTDDNDVSPAASVTLNPINVPAFNILPSVSDDGDQKVVCSVYGCNKFFRRGYELKRHELTHKPLEDRQLFVCDFPNCDRKYTTTNKLNVHKRMKHKIFKSKKIRSDHRLDIVNDQNGSKKFASESEGTDDDSTSHGTNQAHDNRSKDNCNDDSNRSKDNCNDDSNDYDSGKSNLTPSVTCNGVNDNICADLIQDSIFFDHQYTTIKFD